MTDGQIRRLLRIKRWARGENNTELVDLCRAALRGCTDSEAEVEDAVSELQGVDDVIRAGSATL